MTDIDEQIRQALNQEDQELLAKTDNEAGLFDLVGMSFKGKKAWMTWYMWIMGFVVFFLGLYALNLFLGEEDLKTSIGWALVIIACMFVITLIKVISWQQMNKLEIMREIKRLELRILSKQD
ncbi:MAG: hypothetical protein MI746_09960 [Pseudomonadales bacterium]|nr:hypothetical protein [Pseudomonadales bacterium]